VVDAALETSRPVIKAGGHELSVTLPAEPIWLAADPVRLAQVFANLLNNAAKYTEEGGRLRLHAELQGTGVVVSVADSGIGITAEMLPRIFEIFSQAKPALVRSQGGLGIGLSLVKGLVELHGGMIEVRSDGPGQGSEFVVRLPNARTTPVEEPPRPGQDEENRPVCKRRVLIVDDNRDSADSLAMLLNVAGHEVGTAYDGEQALETAEALRPDVILLDIGMPKLNGYEVCRRIREQPWGQGTFLIALTGWGQEEDRRRTEEAGFDHHMVKPVDPAVLMRILASLSSKSGRQLSNL
jgi:CheY-like chemotaxis protein